MLLSKRAAAALPKRTLVCRAVLVLSTLGAATDRKSVV